MLLEWLRDELIKIHDRIFRGLGGISNNQSIVLMRMRHASSEDVALVVIILLVREFCVGEEIWRYPAVF